jgi:hypothetical protein
MVDVCFRGDSGLSSICFNYTLFITFLVSLKIKTNGLQYWVAIYMVLRAV